MLNLAKLMNEKQVFFVPFRQDNPEGKPKSMMAKWNLLLSTMDAAMEGKQMRVAKEKNLKHQSRDRTIKISKKEHDKLHKLAYFDNLTGCYNRNWFVENFSDLDEFKLAIVDINDLKKENDSKGHIAGDALIKDVAQHLMKFGKVVRYGGDEFFVILPRDFDTTVLNSKKYCYGWFVKDKTVSILEAVQLADYCLNMRKKSLKGLFKKGFSSKKLERQKDLLKNCEDLEFM